MPFSKHAFYMKQDFIDSNLESARSDKNDFYANAQITKSAIVNRENTDLSPKDLKDNRFKSNKLTDDKEESKT